MHGAFHARSIPPQLAGLAMAKHRRSVRRICIRYASCGDFPLEKICCNYIIYILMFVSRQRPERRLVQLEINIEYICSGSP